MHLTFSLVELDASATGKQMLPMIEIILIYNPSQNIWHKLKKYRKTGQNFKNLISNFAWFLTAIVNV